MKTKIALITAALLTIFSARADTIALVDTIHWQTNVFYGTNVVTHGDPAPIAFGKINGDIILIWGIVSNGVTGVDFTNTTTLPAGSSATAAVVGYVAHKAIIQLGIPAGYDGTNFVTVFNPAWSIVSSKKIITYQTNNITWSTSNYLGQVAGLSDWNVSFGQLGAVGFTPGTNVFGVLGGSYNGSTWFQITNGFKTTNSIYVSAVGAGGGLGNATLYTTDRPETLGRTNYLYGQEIEVDYPRGNNDIATKKYVDDKTGALKNDTFILSTDTNNITHYAFYGGGQTIQFDLWYQNLYIPIYNLAMDGTTYTNVLMDIWQTNLVGGFTIQSSTNLLLGSAGFVTYTNYTLSTNTGLVTFTMPINQAEDMRFWRAISGAKSGVTANRPVNMNAGATFYRTNAWTAVELTNNGGFAPWLSNYVKVWWSVNSNNVIRNIP